MASALVDLFPTEFDTYYEGFLGGGSVALEVTRRHPGVSVSVNDAWFPLVTFWRVLRDSPDELVETLLHLKASTSSHTARGLVDECRGMLSTMDTTTVDNAAAFYTMNKCGYSGLASGYSQQAWRQNFTERSIGNLPLTSQDIQGWQITNGDYRGTFADVVYLDPPYNIRSALYGDRGDMHEGFDHDEFVDYSERIPSDTMISYNMEMSVAFSDAWTPMLFDKTYTMVSRGRYMKDQRKRKELVLTNYPIPPRDEDLSFYML